jgi:hypothetical protein
MTHINFTRKCFVVPYGAGISESAKHGACKGENTNAYDVMVGKPERKGNLEALRSDRIILKYISNERGGCGLGAFDSAQGQLSGCKQGIERPGPIKSGKTSSATVRFSKTTIFRGNSVLGRHTFARIVLFQKATILNPSFWSATHSPTS